MRINNSADAQAPQRGEGLVDQWGARLSSKRLLVTPYSQTRILRYCIIYGFANNPKLPQARSRKLHEGDRAARVSGIYMCIHSLLTRRDKQAREVETSQERRLSGNATTAAVSAREELDRFTQSYIRIIYTAARTLSRLNVVAEVSSAGAVIRLHFRQVSGFLGNQVESARARASSQNSIYT